MDFDKLNTETFRSQPWGNSVVRMLAAGLKAADPAQAVRRHLNITDHQLMTAEFQLGLMAMARIDIWAKTSCPTARRAPALGSK